MKTNNNLSLNIVKILWKRYTAALYPYTNMNVNVWFDWAHLPYIYIYIYIYIICLNDLKITDEQSK